jgi:hypothetical protein
MNEETDPKIFCRTCKHRKPEEHYTWIHVCRKHYAARWHPVYGDVGEYKLCEDINKNFDCCLWEERTFPDAVRQFWEGWWG